MTTDNSPEASPELQACIGMRVGPYRSYNPVSRVQVWQWCSAMGDRNPLFTDTDFQLKAGFDRAPAPPAMMQMWTMRDVNMLCAPGSTSDDAYAVFGLLQQQGFDGNVAVSYDIRFHRLLLEGDRASHYSTIVAISSLKQTALGAGYFVTERAEFLDQHDALFAEALITYFQYRPAAADAAHAQPAPEPIAAPETGSRWQSDFTDVAFDTLTIGQALPELVIPITHKLIVSGAVATQDFIDVHHNAPAAKAAAMPDIFMNILTTSGLCARYLSDWAGPGSRLEKLQFNLKAPNTPGDTMIMQGRISKLQQDDGISRIGVEFTGQNSRGYHVTGTGTLAFH